VFRQNKVYITILLKFKRQKPRLKISDEKAKAAVFFNLVAQIKTVARQQRENYRNAESK
jgi:hypothetical protein